MTIKDIAKAANVSAATVSRIINHKDENISQETRERVLRVIEEHGYVPYAKIRERILAQSRSLGLMIPTVHSAFYARFVSDIQQLAQENNYSLMLALSSGNPDTDQATLDNFYRNRTDGVIIFSGNDQELNRLKQMRDQGVAVVALDHYARSGTLAQLFRDSKQIARACTQQLLDSNCVRIGLLLRPDCVGQMREVITSGYRGILADAGAFSRQDFIIFQNESFLENFRSMCDSGLDGIVCQDADAAQAIYSAAARDGLRIPEDLSVISMDDAPDAANRTPPLTCAASDVGQMAALAFDCLLSQLNHTPQPFSALRMECPIVQRDSVRQRKNTKPQVLVAGYINTDILLRTPELPIIGKTQIATHIADYVGGKGANQAYGIAKLGGNVSLLGVLGSDRRGRSTYESLVRAGVKMDGVSFLPECPTGSAYISIYPDGKSSVLIDSGANAALNPDYIRRHEALLQKSSLCMIQTDFSLDCVAELRQLCRKHNVPMLITCSYGVRIPDCIMAGLHILILKNKEWEKLYPQCADRETCAQHLLSLGVENVIFFSGISGCYYANRQETGSCPGYDYPSIDQTGTSDVFSGCLAVLLTEGVSFGQAVAAASWAAAYGTTKLGVQNGFPDRSLLEDVLSKHLQLTFG